MGRGNSRDAAGVGGWGEACLEQRGAEARGVRARAVVVQEPVLCQRVPQPRARRAAWRKPQPRELEPQLRWECRAQRRRVGRLQRGGGGGSARVSPGRGATAFCGGGARAQHLWAHLIAGGVVVLLLQREVEVAVAREHRARERGRVERSRRARVASDRRAQRRGLRDAACPISTGGRTRRVHLVRERGGGRLRGREGDAKVRDQGGQVCERHRAGRGECEEREAPPQRA